MKDDEVRACARTFCILRKALRRAGVKERNPERFGPTPAEFENCGRSPLKGLTPLFIKAARNRVLTEADDAFIAATLDEVDASDENMNCRLDERQQGIWQIEYYHWRDYYTPEQVAEKLGVTRQRVSALMKSGQLESIKINSRKCYIPGYSVERRLNNEQAEESE